MIRAVEPRWGEVIVAVTLLALWHALFLYAIRHAQPQVPEMGANWRLIAEPKGR